MKAPGFVVLGILSCVLLIGAFQNCKKSDQQVQEIAKSSNSGNGEAYGGKLSEVYVRVDAKRECASSASTTQYGFLSKIVVEDGVAVMVTKNCDSSGAEVLAWDKLDLRDQGLGLLYYEDVMYQRLKDPEQVFVEPNEFFKWRCRGQWSVSDSQSALPIELFIRSASSDDTMSTVPGGAHFVILLKTVSSTSSEPVHMRPFLSESFQSVAFDLGWHTYESQESVSRVGFSEFRLQDAAKLGEYPNNVLSISVENEGGSSDPFSIACGGS